MRRAKLAWTLPWREKVGAKPIRLDLFFRTDLKSGYNKLKSYFRNLNILPDSFGRNSTIYWLFPLLKFWRYQEKC